MIIWNNRTCMNIGRFPFMLYKYISTENLELDCESRHFYNPSQRGYCILDILNLRR